jgi:glycosyltransferase involved in cell wall biosynthesis
MSSFSAPGLPDLKQRAQPKLREANSRRSLAQQEPVRDPITVIIVAPTLDTGAADAGAAGLVRILADAGHHPIVVSRAGRLVADVVACGGEFIPLDVASNNPIVILRNTVMLTKLARQRKCHAIHAHGRAAAWSAWLAARITGVPFVTTWYKGFREQNVFKRLYNGIMARGDHVVAVSEQLAQLINDRYGTPWTRISVVPSSVDFDRFNPAKVSRERVDAARRSWGVKSETKVILVVGRIHRRKGHDVVIRAVRRLRDMGFKDFLCVFVGEDGRRTRYTGELWDLVLATDAVDVIRMAAPVNDMPAAYAAASVVISAAVQPEGVQRALLEAQAMARPVIVSDLGAGTDVVLTPPAVPEGRVTGLRFPSGDDSALAGAVLRLYSMPEPTRRAIGTRGRAWVLGQFSAATVAEQTLRLYAQIAGREQQAPALVPQTTQN